MFKNFHVINFYVEILSWSGATMKNLFTYVEKVVDYKMDLCVCGFHMYRNIYAMLGSVTPYVSTISGAVVILCASFSPLL